MVNIDLPDCLYALFFTFWDQMQGLVENGAISQLNPIYLWLISAALFLYHILYFFKENFLGKVIERMRSDFFIVPCNLTGLN